jgi:protein TonB
VNVLNDPFLRLVLAGAVLATAVCQVSEHAHAGFSLSVVFPLAIAQNMVPPPASTAPPPSETPHTSGNSPALDPAVADWQKSLASRLQRFQRYPAEAHGASGTVNVSFRIDRQGNVVTSRIENSSGSAILDNAALALLKRASPLPRPPSALPDSNLSFAIPIHFGP